MRRSDERNRDDERDVQRCVGFFVVVPGFGDLFGTVADGDRSPPGFGTPQKAYDLVVQLHVALSQLRHDKS
jgi:hypothetical protein